MVIIRPVGFQFFASTRIKDTCPSTSGGQYERPSRPSTSTKCTKYYYYCYYFKLKHWLSTSRITNKKYPYSGLALQK